MYICYFCIMYSTYVAFCLPTNHYFHHLLVEFLAPSVPMVRDVARRHLLAPALLYIFLNFLFIKISYLRLVRIAIYKPSLYMYVS